MESRLDALRRTVRRLDLPRALFKLGARAFMRTRPAVMAGRLQARAAAAAQRRLRGAGVADARTDSESDEAEAQPWNADGQPVFRRQWYHGGAEDDDLMEERDLMEDVLQARLRHRMHDAPVWMPAPPVLLPPVPPVVGYAGPDAGPAVSRDTRKGALTRWLASPGPTQAAIAAQGDSGAGAVSPLAPAAVPAPVRVHALMIAYHLHLVASEQLEAARGELRAWMAHGGDRRVRALLMELALWRQLLVGLTLHRVGNVAEAQHGAIHLAPPLPATAALLENLAHVAELPRLIFNAQVTVRAGSPEEAFLSSMGLTGGTDDVAGRQARVTSAGDALRKELLQRPGPAPGDPDAEAQRSSQQARAMEEMIGVGPGGAEAALPALLGLEHANAEALLGQLNRAVLALSERRSELCAATRVSSLSPGYASAAPV